MTFMNQGIIARYSTLMGHVMKVREEYQAEDLYGENMEKGLSTRPMEYTEPKHGKMMF